MKTVIMAGGKGTRISEMFPDIPKPLIPITFNPPAYSKTFIIPSLLLKKIIACIFLDVN